MCQVYTSALSVPAVFAQMQGYGWWCQRGQTRYPYPATLSYQRHHPQIRLLYVRLQPIPTFRPLLVQRCDPNVILELLCPCMVSHSVSQPRCRRRRMVEYSAVHFYWLPDHAFFAPSPLDKPPLPGSKGGLSGCAVPASVPIISIISYVG